MKKIGILSMTLWLGMGICSAAQIHSTPEEIPQAGIGTSPDSLLKKVLENNRTLRTARESYQMEVLAAGTGNAPPNPEVEFEYLYGSPSRIGNQVDFSVSQQVDFPTTYIYKSRLRKIRTSQAELGYILSRQEVMLQARQLWIEKIYLNQQEKLLSERLGQANTINDHFQQKLESGEVSSLAFSQANLQRATIQGEYDQVLVDLRNLSLALNEIAGGIQVEVVDTLFPAPVLIIPDSLLEAYQQGPEMQNYTHELQSKEEQKNLAVSKTLPKLKAGYYSESLLDLKLRGFQIGITVPLWENSNRIKQAKSEILFAEADAERYTSVKQRELLQKLDQWVSLQSRTQKLEEALSTGNSMELLALSLKSGEISMTEYFYASDFYYRNRQLLLEYKRDLLLQETDLLKVYM